MYVVRHHSSILRAMIVLLSSCQPTAQIKSQIPNSRLRIKYQKKKLHLTHQCLAPTNHPPSRTPATHAEIFFLFNPSRTAMSSNACLPSRYLSSMGHATSRNSGSVNVEAIFSSQRASRAEARSGEGMIEGVKEEARGTGWGEDLGDNGLYVDGGWGWS